MNQVIDKLGKLLANTAALSLKTQNYHWHVTGPNFKSLHLFFEEQYKDLYEAMDTIAERIRALGGFAPASFEEFNKLSTIKSGNPKLSADAMIKELCGDHKAMVNMLADILLIAQQAKDDGTSALLGERLFSHEKTGWMLTASQ